MPSDDLPRSQPGPLERWIKPAAAASAIRRLPARVRSAEHLDLGVQAVLAVVLVPVAGDVEDRPEPRPGPSGNGDDLAVIKHRRESGETVIEHPLAPVAHQLQFEGRGPHREIIPDLAPWHS